VKRPPGRITLGEYLDEWIETYTIRRPGNTAARYRYGLSKLRDLPIWRARLTAIEPYNIGRSYDALPPEKIPHIHDALHKALADAVPRLLGRNPASGAMRGRRHDRAERAVWIEDEYRAFLAAAAEDEMYVLWLTLGQTGARRGEVLGLNWPDLDLMHGQVTIRRQYAAVAGKLTLKDVKTARGRRTIEIDDGLAGVLRDWQKAQPTRLLGRDAHAVFTYTDGSRIGPTSALNDRFDAVIERAGVRRITIHDMRHVHATLSLRRGVPVHVVSKRLGHASEGFTLQQYAHVLPDQGRLAADAAAAIAGKLPEWRAR
jgi:integrase